MAVAPRALQAHRSLASGTRPPKGLGPSRPNVRALAGQSAELEPTHLGWRADNSTFQILRTAILSNLLLYAHATGYLHLPPSSLSATTPIGGEPRRPESPAWGHRSREVAFQEAHPEVLRPFAGQWVVLEGETIIAHGDDPARVVSDARSKGVRIPYVLFVEEATDDVAWIGL